MQSKETDASEVDYLRSRSSRRCIEQRFSRPNMRGYASMRSEVGNFWRKVPEIGRSVQELSFWEGFGDLRSQLLTAACVAT